MNEKIKQFAEQAGLETQPAKLKIYKNDDGTVTSGGWEYPLEKFAELIVQECADIALREEHDPYECIKRHFGLD